MRCLGLFHRWERREWTGEEPYLGIYRRRMTACRRCPAIKNDHIDLRGDTYMNKRNIDVMLEPTKDAGRASVLAPASLRAYESSIEGMLTVCTYRTDRFGPYIESGTRLTVEQVTELRDTLNAFLAKQGAEVTAR